MTPEASGHNVGIEPVSPRAILAEGTLLRRADVPRRVFDPGGGPAREAQLRARLLGSDLPRLRAHREAAAAAIPAVCSDTPFGPAPKLVSVLVVIVNSSSGLLVLTRGLSALPAVPDADSRDGAVNQGAIVARRFLVAGQAPVTLLAKDLVHPASPISTSTSRASWHRRAAPTSTRRRGRSSLWWQ